MQNQRVRRKKQDWTGLLYIFPAFLFFAVFVLWPVLNTIAYSFTNWTGFSPPSFIGLQNYFSLLNDDLFRTAILNNLKFIAFYTLFPIGIALLLTSLLTRRRIKGLSLFRAGFFIPYLMPMVVVGVVWRWIYNPVFGLLNDLLEALGLGALARPWLGDFDAALPAVGVVATWAMYGFCLVLFISGVQRVDESLYDAAKVDGANGWQQLWNVTIPGIRSEISVAAVSTFISALRTFDLVFVTTRGGPGNSTLVTSLMLYTNAFQINRVGLAAAIAVLQSAAILVISTFLLSFLRGDEEDVRA